MFAINLDRSPDRWAKMQTHFGDLPWGLQRVAAIDASTDPDTVLDYRRQKLIQPPTGVGWSWHRLRMFALIEEACFCSHLKALRQFLSTEFESGLILEDDAYPIADLAASLTHILPSIQGSQVVKLSGSKKRGARLAVNVTEGPHALVRSFVPSSNAAAYLVTRESAARLIDNAGTRLLPFDDYLSYSAYHGCDILHVSPLVIDNKGQKSTMSSARSSLRHVKKRDPLSLLLSFVRRAYLRVILYGSALRGFPTSLLRIRKTGW